MVVKENEFNRLIQTLREKGLAIYNSKSKFQGDSYTRGSWLHAYVQDQLCKILGPPNQVQIISEV